MRAPSEGAVPTKTKPKFWGPLGLDDVSELTDIYPPEVLRRICAHAELTDEEKLGRLNAAVLEAAMLLYLGLHYEGRPKVPEKRAALHEIGILTAQLRWKLHHLDHDSRVALYTQADSSDSEFIETGDIHVGRILTELRYLNVWANAACPLKGKKGRPSKGAVSDFCERLTWAWHNLVGVPSRRVNWRSGEEYGPLGVFIREAACPQNVSISDDMIKRALKLVKNSVG